MSLPDVAKGGQHIAAHNAERHAINDLQDLTSSGRLAPDATTTIWKSNTEGYVDDIQILIGPSGEFVMCEYGGNPSGSDFYDDLDEGYLYYIAAHSIGGLIGNVTFEDIKANLNLPDPNAFLTTQRSARAAGKRLHQQLAGTQRQNTRVTVSAISNTATNNQSLLSTSMGTTGYVNSTRIWTTPAAHGLTVGDVISFDQPHRTGIAFLTGAIQYVITTPSSTTFTASYTKGGSAPDLGSDGSVTSFKNIPDTYYAWVYIGAATVTASDDTFTTTSPHFLSVGSIVRFYSSTAGGVVNGTTYYVKTTPSSTTFTVSTQVRASTLNVTSDGTVTWSVAQQNFLFSDFRPNQRATTSPADVFATYDTNVISVGSGLGDGGALTASMIIDKDRFEYLYFNDGSSDHAVTIDGVLIDTTTAAQLSSSGISSGNIGQKSFVFQDSRPRVVSIRSAGVIGAVSIPKTSTIAKPLVTNRGHWMFIGDSFTEGAGSTSFGQNSYVRWVQKLLGLTNVWQCGSGSTGYLSDGARLRLVSRYQTDIINQLPDVVVIAMGINDDTSTSTTRNAALVAAQVVWDNIISRLPDAELVVIGPFWPKGIGTNGVDYRNTNMLAFDAILQTAAVSRGLRYISPLQENWIQGDGKVGATTGHGNADIYTSSDGTHPTDLGHEYLGWRIAGHLSIPYAPTTY